MDIIRNIDSILLGSFRATSFNKFVPSVALVEFSLLVSLYRKFLQSGTCSGDVINGASF